MKKVTLRATIRVEVESPEFDDPETIADDFFTETEYNFSNTDCVNVIDTEFTDLEIVDQ